MKKNLFFCLLVIGLMQPLRCNIVDEDEVAVNPPPKEEPVVKTTKPSQAFTLAFPPILTQGSGKLGSKN